MALAAGAGILIAVLGLLIELVLSVLFLLVEVLGLISGSGGDERKQQRPSRLMAIFGSQWFRRAGIVACGCLLLTLLAGVIHVPKCE